MHRTVNVFLAVTGASGVVYGVRLLRALAEVEVEVGFTCSPTARRIMKRELGVTASDGDLLGALDVRGEGVRWWEATDFSAPYASGSARWQAMVIAPCSMGTLGRIANGVANNLITRAADVALKERRRLILVPRETPLSLIHLENMTRLTRAGAIILPASPSFYGQPRSIDELVDTVVARVLDHLDIPHSLATRWGDGE